jgi:hypothetical protein
MNYIPTERKLFTVFDYQNQKNYKKFQKQKRVLNFINKYYRAKSKLPLSNSEQACTRRLMLRHAQQILFWSKPRATSSLAAMRSSRVSRILFMGAPKARVPPRLGSPKAGKSPRLAR